MAVELICFVEKCIAIWAKETFEEIFDVIDVNNVFFLYRRCLTVISHLTILLRVDSPMKSSMFFSTTSSTIGRKSVDTLRNCLLITIQFFQKIIEKKWAWMFRDLLFHANE